MVCDFAEVYHIYDIRSLSVTTAATFFCGLRAESRARQALSGDRFTFNQQLAMLIYDKLALLWWAKTGGKKKDCPTPLYNQLTDTSGSCAKFKDGNAFERKRQQLLNKRGGKNG